MDANKIESNTLALSCQHTLNPTPIVTSNRYARLLDEARVLISILFASILVAPNRHFFHVCCCFHCLFWSMTQFALRNCPARIQTCPAPVPSGSDLCYAFIEAPATVCASSQGMLRMWVVFLYWHCHTAWSTSYLQE